MGNPISHAEAMQAWMDDKEDRIRAYIGGEAPKVRQVERKPLPGEIIHEGGYVLIIDATWEKLVLNGRPIEQLNNPQILRALERNTLISNGELTGLGNQRAVYFNIATLRSFLGRYYEEGNQPNKVINGIEILLSEPNRPGLLFAINDMSGAYMLLKYSPDFAAMYTKLTGLVLDAPTGSMDAYMRDNRLTKLAEV